MSLLLPPPLLDKIASKLSRVILINIEYNCSRDNTKPYIKILESLIPKDKLESKVT